MSDENRQFREEGGGYLTTWAQEQASIHFDKLIESRGEVKGEIRVGTTMPGVAQHLHQVRMTLTSSRSRTEVGNYVKTRVNSLDWDGLVEQACILTLRAFRRGEPVLTLSADAEVSAPEYLIWPMLPLRQPTILFGLGAAGKSTMALLFGICATLSWAQNPLGLLPPEEPVNVLWLDWETDHQALNYNLKRLRDGMELPLFEFQYRRCFLPLHDDISEIQKIIADKEIGLVVFDSLAAACGSELNAAEGATQFLSRHIRQLKTTSLIIAHTQKGGEGQKSIYGSVFFENYARSVWEVKKHQELGEDALDVGLHNRKSNMSKLFRPLGCRFHYSDEDIRVEALELKDSPGFADDLPLHERIAEYLKHEPATVEDLAEEFGKPENLVRAELARRKQKFIKLPSGKWGVRFERDDV